MAKITKKHKRKKPVGRHHRINVATLICIFIFIYMLVRVITSFSQPKISTYEVTTQKIYDTISTTAMAIRTEKVVTAQQAGYVIYYVGDGERVGVNSKVYAIDGSGSVMQQFSDEDGDFSFSEDDYIDLKNQIMDYKSNYQDKAFSTVYDFKYALNNNIMEMTNDYITKKVSQMKEENSLNSSLNQVKANECGVVSYCFDGLENVTLDSLDASYFAHPETDMKQIRSNDEYTSGSPIYRLVTDENWNLVMKLSEEQYNLLKDKSTLKVKFLKDGFEAERNADFFERGGNYFVSLSFNKYMERYMSDRYLSVEIVLESLEGLKLPNSSLLKEKLYSIPMDFVVQSDEAVSGVSFLKQDSKDTQKLITITPSICYEDTDAGLFYVSSVDVSPGDVFYRNATDNEIKTNEFSDTYTIGNSKQFEGIYTINKGFAQFIAINKLYQADDFCIVQPDMTYGISQYDHVVLDSDSIKEGQIIY